MPKKISAKQDQKIEAEAQANFATDVIELYRARMAGQPAVPHPDADVRAVAFGLVALKQAIAPHLHQHRNDPHALVYTGVVMADGIIEALITGHGPLWRHIGALQTETYRPSAAPGAHEMQCREMLSGLVLAYQETAGVKQWKAARAVAEGIKAQDFPFTAGQLGKWIDRAGGNSAAVRKYADKFLADADEQAFRRCFLPAGKIMPPDTERILIVGREAMFSILVVPS
jgi:hypothetical protein